MGVVILEYIVQLKGPVIFYQTFKKTGDFHTTFHTTFQFHIPSYSWKHVAFSVALYGIMYNSRINGQFR